MNDRNRELKPFVPQPDDDMIVCRCEEITKTCKIYNKDYHLARFALPNYLKELL